LSSATGGGPAGRAGAVRSRPPCESRAGAGCRRVVPARRGGRGPAANRRGTLAAVFLDLQRQPAREERGSSGRDGLPRPTAPLPGLASAVGVQGASSCGRWSRWADSTGRIPRSSGSRRCGGRRRSRPHRRSAPPPPAGLRARVARDARGFPARRTSRVESHATARSGIGHHAHRRRVDQDAIVQGPESLQDTGKRTAVEQFRRVGRAVAAFQDIQPRDLRGPDDVGEGTRASRTSTRPLPFSSRVKARCRFGLRRSASTMIVRWPASPG